MWPWSPAPTGQRGPTHTDFRLALGSVSRFRFPPSDDLAEAKVLANRGLSPHRRRIRRSSVNLAVRVPAALDRTVRQPRALRIRALHTRPSAVVMRPGLVRMLFTDPTVFTAATSIAQTSPLPAESSSVRSMTGDSSVGAPSSSRPWTPTSQGAPPLDISSRSPSAG
jgi:hypothetical protein